MNLVERKRRLQTEAIANLGEGENERGLELVATDDMETDEGDVFERVKKFSELEKRFNNYRRE